MKKGFFLVVDGGLAPIAILVSRKLVDDYNLDVHVFIEDVACNSFDAFGVPRLFLHYNQLSRFLPADMPANQRWPRIVYLRIFAPFMLEDYDRLIYLDADIIPLNISNEVWRTDMCGKLGAVSDIGLLEKSPTSGISKQQWLRSIGVQGDRYFNSGFLLIDVAHWTSIKFSERLLFFAKVYHGSIRFFDQDFLNWLFQDDWFDLGPAWNFQASCFGIGLEEIINPIFIHFSKPEKPWMFQFHQDIRDIDNIAARYLMKMSRHYCIDLAHMRRSKSVALRVKHWMRYRLSRLGILTFKEWRLRKKLREQTGAVERYMHKNTEAFARSFISSDLKNKLEADLVFDGKTLRSPVSERFVRLFGV